MAATDLRFRAADLSIQATDRADDGVLEQAEEHVLEADGPADDPLRVTLDAESRQRLIAALTDVPPLQRDAFLLHVEAGLSLEEIAGLTSASVETVKSRLRYAYRRLRNALEDRSS